MQFLNPIWLWGIGAIAIPVIIHLWNTRPGRVMKVGSIALLEKSRGQSANNIKLRELLLLCLRCLLIVLLAVLLANPIFQTINNNRSKPWLVISKYDLPSALANHRSEIDSLLGAGFELRNTDTLFSVYSFADSVKISGENLLHGWDALRELNLQVPDSTTAVIYTNLSMKNYRSDRPAVSPKLQWRPIAKVGDSLQWLQQAQLMPKDSVQLIWGKGNQRITRFNLEVLDAAALNRPHFTNSFDNGQLKVGWKPAGPNQVLVDTTTLKIVVVPGNNKTDANYLLAALSAIKDNSLQSMKVLVQDASEPIDKADWVFWLSDAAAPRPGHGEKLFRYSANKLNPVNNLLARSNGKPAATTIPIFQQAAEDSLRPVWEDGSGGMLLGSRGDELIYTSRFNPAAAELVWNEAFPALLNELINEPDVAVFEKLWMNPVQAKPAVNNDLPQMHRFAGQLITNRGSANARLYLVLLIMLVFIAERLLSHRNRQPRLVAEAPF